jgi:regulation of enolase protein 1 (concanavalin A-like superfamily)
VRATGTPEPEPLGTALPGWGLAINPDRDCKLTPAGPRSLAVDIPAKMHDLGGALRKLNAPRVVREVDGDFAVTVKVSGELKPRAPSTNPRSVPYLAAGLFVWVDSDNFIRLERAAMTRGRVIPHIAFLEQEGGYGGAVHNEGFPEGACYLRLERKGSRIFGGVSRDGRNWKELKPIDTVWPEKLKVGLLAISTSSDPFSVKFEEFDLKVKGAGTSGVKE